MMISCVCVLIEFHANSFANFGNIAENQDILYEIYSNPDLSNIQQCSFICMRMCVRILVSSH